MRAGSVRPEALWTVTPPWSHARRPGPSGKMTAMATDPRAAVEYRIPATSLRKGDLINTDPSEQDWQEVIAVYTSAAQAETPELRELVASVEGRYVVVELTDLAPVDSGVFYVDGVATVLDGENELALSDVVSGEDGVRTYLYTKYELVSVREK
jgi:hypothetical protein